VPGRGEREPVQALRLSVFVRVVGHRAFPGQRVPMSVLLCLLRG
jgi:hypothetical protein